MLLSLFPSFRRGKLINTILGYINATRNWDNVLFGCFLIKLIYLIIRKEKDRDV